MSKPGLSFGLNVRKKPGPAKPVPSKRKPLFGDDDDSDDGNADGEACTEIGGRLDLDGTTSEQSSSQVAKQRGALPTQPPKLKPKSQKAVFGDLSNTLSSKKNAETAEKLDPSVYEYDSVYDSLKPTKEATTEDVERKPKYMKSLMQAAEVRKRDALIAEEKKIAREREAEGDEYADKEKFVTEAYKKQQEENKRLEAEERKREEEEAKKNEGGGMSAFYRKLLDQGDERHSRVVKAAEERAKQGPQTDQKSDEEMDKDKAEARLAQDLNEKGASIALNEDGEVVDKRQLLQGGLNVGAKKKQAVEHEAGRARESSRSHFSGAKVDRKQAMRERQTRMLEEQLEQSLKRSREDEKAQREEVERTAKSRKTEGEISSARERYLARKREAEEAKKQGSTE